MIDFSKNPHLEPECAARSDRYKQFKRIFKGDHQAALANLIGRVPENKRDLIYVAVNLAGLISRKCSDFLFGEAPGFEGKTTGDTDTIKELVEALNLQTALYEAGLSQSYQGDVVLRLRVSEQKLKLEEIPAGNYFVEQHSCNVREVLSEAIAYVVCVGGKQYLRVEHHEPGLITHEAFALNSEGQVRERVSLQVTDGEHAPPDQEKTGVDRSLLFHFVNFRLGTEWWGISDYHDLVGLFDALNNRLSSIDRILGRHANPKLVMPRGMTDGNLDATRDLFVVENGDDAKNIYYVTWEGQLSAAFTELDKLVDFILWLAEMAPSLLGLDKSGAPESGKALRLRFIPTEHKVNRKKRYFDPIIKALLVTASELGAFWHVPEISALSDEPTIKWQDGLPKIFTEMAEDLTKLHDAGLVSALTAIAQLWDLDPEAAELELERIQEEKKGALPDVATQNFENGGQDNQLDGNVAQPDNPPDATGPQQKQDDGA